MLPSIRRFRADCRILIQSPLCRHVTVAVFLGIVVIEAIILLPSYWRRESEFLTQLERESVQAAGVLLSAEAVSGLSIGAQVPLKNILAAHDVVGIAILDQEGRILKQAGEPVGLTHAVIERSATRRLRSPDGNRYEIYLPAETTHFPVGLALRLDSTWVAPELAAFTIRILGLVLLISVFVTVVTMLVLGQRLIFPMLRLREGLGAAKSLPITAQLQVPRANRDDEFGDVVRDFNAMMRQIAESGHQARSLAKFPSENPNPVLRVGPDGGVIYANEVCNQIDALIGEDDELNADLVAEIDLAFRSRRHRICEIELGHRAFSFSINPIFEEGYTSVYARDITAERDAERLLRRAKEELEERVRARTRELEARSEELRASESKFKAVFENCPSVIYLKDTDSRLVLVNPRYEELYQASADLVIGRTPEDWMPPELAARFIALDREVIRTGEIQESEYERCLPSGEIRTLSSTKFPVVDEVGRVTAVGGFVTDVTSQKRAMEAIEAAKDSAEAANEAKSQFLANMSHEIRTPMNGVLGMSRLVLDTDLAEHQREFVETIVDSGEALLTIINDILDYSKLEAGKLSLDIERFDPRDAVDGVMQLMGPQIEDKNLDWRVAYSEDLPRHVAGDAGRMRQVLINILGNAVKFTDRGSITIEVSVLELDDATALVRVAVTDTGIGIADHHRARLFDRFSQADESSTRRFGGTGLGLPISRLLVERMGGEISVESEAGRGSTFAFTMRLAPVEGPDHADMSPQSMLRGAMPRPLHILLAEDDDANRRIAVEMLTGAGHRVGIAADGIEAVNAVHQDDFDVVLMDVQMPNMDGLAAARAIRAFAGDKARIPIIAVTSNAMSDDRDRYLASGFDDYVSKPFAPPELFDALARRMEASPEIPTAYASAPGASEEADAAAADPAPAIQTL